METEWNGPRVAQSIMWSYHASMLHALRWCDDSTSAKGRLRGMEEDATGMQADLESDIAGSRPPAHWIASQPDPKASTE
jgi:hypothetical protein